MRKKENDLWVKFKIFQYQHHYRQQYSVKGKDDKSVALQELEQEFNGEITGDNGRQKSQNVRQGEKGIASGFEQLQGMIHSGPENNGGGQQKRKSGCRFPGEAQKQAHGHGAAAPGDTGHDGQSLGTTHQDGVG
jgi:hypothetical protein